jgi:hypothetical protein
MQEFANFDSEKKIPGIVNSDLQFLLTAMISCKLTKKGGEVSSLAQLHFSYILLKDKFLTYITLNWSENVKILTMCLLSK